MPLVGVVCDNTQEVNGHLTSSVGGTVRGVEQCIQQNTPDRERAVGPSAAWRSSFEVAQSSHAAD